MATARTNPFLQFYVHMVFSVICLVQGSLSRHHTSECSNQMVGDRHFFTEPYRVPHDHRLILQDYLIKCSAKIVRWEVFVPESGCQLTAEVWRFVKKRQISLSATMRWDDTIYELRAHTELPTTMSGHIVKFLEGAEQIEVGLNDVIGVRFRSSNGKKCLLFAEDHSPYPGKRVCFSPVLGAPEKTVDCNMLSEHPLNLTFSAMLSFDVAKADAADNWNSVFPPAVWTYQDNQNETSKTSSKKPEESRRKKQPGRGFFKKFESAPPPTTTTNSVPSPAAQKKGGQVSTTLWLTAAVCVGATFVMSFLFVYVSCYYWTARNRNDSNLLLSKPIKKTKVIMLKASSLTCFPKQLNSDKAKTKGDEIEQEADQPSCVIGSPV